MNMGFALTAALAFGTFAGAAPAKAGCDCDNFFGQRCVIDLASGVHMSYFEVGSANGETLILLHTDTTSAFEWPWTVNALLTLDSNPHVLALDQRGAGFSDLPRTMRCGTTPNVCITAADLAADVLAFMDAKKISKATLVGHAMGASVARLLALEHPDRVLRLILSGTGLPRPPQAQAPRNAPDAMAPLGWRQILEVKGVKWPQGALHMRPIDIDPDAVRNNTRHWDMSAIAAPEMVEAIAAQTAAESLATWGTLDPTPLPPSAPARLETLSVPILVLWGSEDAGLSRISQDKLIEVLRQARQTHPGMYFY